MSLEGICEEWVRSEDPALRERLLATASERPESLSAALDRGRGLTARRPEEAVLIADFATSLADRRQEPLQAAAGFRIRGQALRVLGRHQDAIGSFNAAADRARTGQDMRLAAQVRVGAIDSLGMLGRYEEAFELAHRLESELREAGAPVDAARALCNAGNLYFRLDRYGEALDCYEQSGEILERSGDPLMAAAVWINCANVLTQLHRPDEAIARYEKAAAVYESRALAVEAAVVDTNLGFLHSMSGRPAVALRFFTEARDEFDAVGRQQDAARCDIDAAEAYRSLNLHPEALACCERAAAAIRGLGNDYDTARAELGRAASLAALRRGSEALDTLERADAVFRRQRNAVQRAHVRLTRAYLLGSEGRRQEARREAEIAGRAFARRKLRGWAAEARFLPASLDLEAGIPAVRAMSAVSRGARDTERGWLECRAERALGSYYARRGDRDRALRHLRSGVGALERARTLIAPEAMHLTFLEDKLAVYEDLVRELLSRGTPDDLREALECVERSKSRLLLERIHDALGQREVADHPEVTALRRRVSTLRAELARAQRLAQDAPGGDPRRVGAPAVSIPGGLAATEAAYLEALRELDLRTAPATLRHSAIVPVEQLQAALVGDEVLVEFCVAGEELSAFLVSKDQLQVRRLTARADELRYLARRLRFHLQKMELGAMLPASRAHAQSREIHEVLRALFFALLAPLEDALPPDGRVILVPHGFLHGLPFQAFFDGARYALDRWELLFSPSAAIWHAGTQDTDTGHGGLPPLLMALPAPGIERVAGEVEQLAQLFGDARVYCGAEATVDRFRTEAQRPSRFLHLATHARFRSDNPLFSGFQLADGWVLARDLYEMSLHCELATLSACHTGVAAVEPGDELFGLVRGFLAAGARSVTGSLWSADDAATTTLMTEFYRGIVGGRSKADALRVAQRRTREEYPHPYYWAAFALFGRR